MGNKVDFFISYTGPDEQWAKWIAGELEDKKYTTIIQAWDFKPGTNFVSNMHNALIHCERFIAVISPDYFKSLYCQAEWTAAFTRDPSCEKALFIPVRVKECKPEGLFAPVVYIDLHGIEEQEAVETLLNGLSTDRPRNRPGFPGTSNKPKFPGQLPFNNLPFNKNKNFTGRQTILEDIEKLFRPGHDNPLVLSISGLGGVGKTQIVLEYAFRYGYLYDTIWWIDAEDSLALFKFYSSFAYKNRLVNKETNERDIILEAVRNWMSQHANWLFIYDNAEDPKTLNEYLPGINRGHILITSRYTNWYRLGEVICIDVFEPEEAVEFLIKSIGTDDRKSAAILVAELGFLPLALEQAAAYILKNKNIITYEKYVELFKKYKLEIFKEDGYESTDYRYTVAVTWNISIGKIDNESSKQLLNICSFLASDNIDRNIFTDSNKCLPEPLASEVLSELKYNTVIFQLAQYSLIKLQNNQISIHRLLQEVIRQSVNKKEWLGYCLNSMHELFYFDYKNQKSWYKLPEIVPHVISVAKHSDGVSVYLEKVAWLYNETSGWLEHTAAYEEAEPLYKRSLEIREEVLGAKHPSTANSLNNLALLYDKQGRYEEAEPLYKRSLEIREEVLGAKHPDTATSLNNLAGLYDKQGRYEEAEPLYKRSLEIREEVLGAKHPDTATSLNNLAGL
ncbi:tetratricopeptide repeat protein, partial [Desulfosporosinus nitroreducens]